MWIRRGGGGPAMWKRFLLLLYFEALFRAVFAFFNTYLVVLSPLLPNTEEKIKKRKRKEPKYTSKRVRI